jgi:hypothetical protein
MIMARESGSLTRLVTNALTIHATQSILPANHGRAVCCRRRHRQGIGHFHCVSASKVNDLVTDQTPCRCSHAGVTNVVRDAIKQFQRPIHMILGGLHLGGPELYERIAPTVEFLSRRIRPAPTYILPMHCSGFPAKAALEKEFGEGCVVASVGMRYEVHGDEGFEERLNVSVS